MSAPINYSSNLGRRRRIPCSKYAVDWAAREATMRNVRLTIVHPVRPLGYLSRRWRRRQL